MVLWCISGLVYFSKYGSSYRLNTLVSEAPGSVSNSRNCFSLHFVDAEYFVNIVPVGTFPSFYFVRWFRAVLSDPFLVLDIVSTAASPPLPFPGCYDLSVPFRMCRFCENSRVTKDSSI